MSKDGEEGTHLFLLRLWKDGSGDEHPSWHGKVQHLMNGQSRFLPNLSTLDELLLVMMHDSEPALGEEASSEGNTQEPAPSRNG